MHHVGINTTTTITIHKYWWKPGFSLMLLTFSILLILHLCSGTTEMQIHRLFGDDWESESKETCEHKQNIMINLKKHNWRSGDQGYWFPARSGANEPFLQQMLEMTSVLKRVNSCIIWQLYKLNINNYEISWHSTPDSPQ